MASQKRVLIIEDHDDSREMLAALVRRSGFHVSAYDRCAPAEPHLESGDMDIALLDVEMPDRCGDDFARELRERCPKTMIVFVTGADPIHPLKETVPDCFVLRKPVDAAVLLKLLACVDSDARYGSPMSEATEDRPLRGKM